MKQAVILAAGEGQRLRPFTANRPKVMIKIAGKPILQYVVEALKNNGITDIIIVCGYKKEHIYDYFEEDEDLRKGIRYVEQDKQLGTAHALKCAENLLGEEFLVLPGDNIIEKETIKGISSGKDWAMLVSRQETPLRNTIVGIDGGLVQKPLNYSSLRDDASKEEGIHFVNTGIFRFDNRIFNYIKDELDMPDAVNSALNGGIEIKASITDNTWLDLAYCWDILHINSIMQERNEAGIAGILGKNISIEGKVRIGEGTHIYPNCYIKGPVVIGEGCEIGPNTCITSSTCIGDNAVIGAFAEINNCVIGSDVTIESGVFLQDSVVDKGCQIGKKSLFCSGEVEVSINYGSKFVRAGSMIGANCAIGCGVSAAPGAIIGNRVKIEPFKQVKGILPDESIVV